MITYLHDFILLLVVFSITCMLYTTSSYDSLIICYQCDLFWLITYLHVSILFFISPYMFFLLPYHIFLPSLFFSNKVQWSIAAPLKVKNLFHLGRFLLMLSTMWFIPRHQQWGWAFYVCKGSQRIMISTISIAMMIPWMRLWGEMMSWVGSLMPCDISRFDLWRTASFWMKLQIKLEMLLENDVELRTVCKNGHIFNFITYFTQFKVYWYLYRKLTRIYHENHMLSITTLHLYNIPRSNWHYIFTTKGNWPLNNKISINCFLTVHITFI